MASSPEEHAVKTAESDTPTRAIALLALAAFASAANLRVCDPLLPQIASELGVTVGTAALTVTAFALAYGVFQVVVGPLSDARGRLSMVVLGSIWAGIATVVSAGMPTPRAAGVVALPRLGWAPPRSFPWRSPGSGTSSPTSGASRCSHATSRGRSWASCSGRRREASSAS